MKWNYRDDLPIYSQLVEQLKKAIVSGELKPGERLMSVRELAMEAGVNPNTMQRALAELEQDGLVYTQRTAGRYVTEDIDTIEKIRTEMASEHVRRFRDDMTELGFEVKDIIKLLKEES